jgi:hypothetical protein
MSGHNEIDRAACGYYEAWTHHGSILAVERQTGLLCHKLAVEQGYARVLVWAPQERPEICFFISPYEEQQGLLLENDFDLDRPRTISFRWAERDQGYVTFQHPLSDLFLCAEEMTGDQGRVSVNRHEANIWESFRLHPLNDVEKHIVYKVSQIQRDLKTVGSGLDAFSHLLSSSGDPRGSLVDLPSVLRVLPARELASFARAVAHNADACRGIVAAYANENIWARALLGTAVGDQSSPRPTVAAIDESLDYLVNGNNGKYASVVQMCNSFARQSRKPNRDLCVVTTARNEGLYFLEWIAFHQLLGVDYFFVYTNDNTDGSDDLLRALADAKIISWVRNKVNPGISPQYKAYGHAFQIQDEILDFRWAGVIDLDEFIVIDRKKFTSINELISQREAEGADAIALNWLIFGGNGEERFRDEPVIQRFYRREKGVNRHVKSLFRPQLFMHCHCHHPIWDDFVSWKFVSASGRPHPQSRNGDDNPSFSPAPSDDCAWVNHYWSKSVEEFALRRTIGRADLGFAGNPSTEFLIQYVGYFVDQFAPEDKLIDNRAIDCAPGIVAQIEWLRALPGVHAAMLNIEALYRERVRTIAASLASDPRFQVVGTNEKWIADIMGAGHR